MESYKERMKHEYLELKDRYEKLHRMLIKEQADTLDFDLTCPFVVLKEQELIMKQYLEVLELRAAYEEIDLYS